MCTKSTGISLSLKFRIVFSSCFLFPLHLESPIFCLFWIFDQLLVFVFFCQFVFLFGCTLLRFSSLKVLQIYLSRLLIMIHEINFQCPSFDFSNGFVLNVIWIQNESKVYSRLFYNLPSGLGRRSSTPNTAMYWDVIVT